MATIFVRGPSLYIRPNIQKGKWRGAQIEFQQPITLQNRCAFQNDAFQGWIGAVQSFQMCGGFWDSDGAVTGDATASAEGDFSVLTQAVPSSQLRDIRPGRPVKLGRGAQLEFDQPAPLMILHNVDGDGAASGDSTADAASAFDVYPFSNWQDEHLRRGPRLSIRRLKGAQFEFQTPLPIQIISNRDGDGSAIGDAIASGTIDGLGDMAATATGDSTASAVGTSDAYPFANWSELLLRRGPNKAVKLGRGTQIEFQQPITTGTQISALMDGAAQGDAIAAAAGASLADGLGAASGDAIAAASGESLADSAGTASGDATASATSDSTFFDFSVWCENALRRGPGRLAKLGRGSQLEFRTNFPLTVFSNGLADGLAIGDSTADGFGEGLLDADGSAIGDAIASGEGEGLILHDGDGAASGDAEAFGISAYSRRPVKVISTRPSAKRGKSGVSMRGVSSAIASSPRGATQFVLPVRGTSSVCFDPNAFWNGAFQTQTLGSPVRDGTSPRSVTEVTP